MKHFAAALLATTALAWPAYGQTAADSNSTTSPLPNSGQCIRLFGGVSGIGVYAGGKCVSAPVAFVNLPHVANNAALTLLSPTTGRVRREGFASSGDGGVADYNTTATKCSLASGGGDGGSQVGLIGPGGTAGTYVGCAIADLREPVDARIWGGDPTGAAYSQTQDQAAISAVIAAGLHNIYFTGHHVWNPPAISVLGNYLHIYGVDGARITIVGSNDGIDLGNTTATACCTYQGLSVTDLIFDSPGAKSGGAAVHNFYNYNTTISRLQLTNQYYGIQSSGSSFTHIDANSILATAVSSATVSSAASAQDAAIRLDVGDGNAVVTHNNMDNSSSATPWADLSIGGGVSGAFIGFNNGGHAIHPLYMSNKDVSGSTIANLFLTQNSWDFGSSDNGYISCDDANGGYITRLNMQGEWYATSTGGNGLLVQGTNCATTSVQVRGPEALNNAYNGISFVGNVSDFDVTDAHAGGNSTTKSGNYEGISVGSGSSSTVPSHFAIRGGRSGATGVLTNIQSFGVAILAGAMDYYTISGVDVSRNVNSATLGGVYDAGTGLHKNVSLNLDETTSIAAGTVGLTPGTSGTDVSGQSFTLSSGATFAFPGISGSATITDDTTGRVTVATFGGGIVALGLSSQQATDEFSVTGTPSTSQTGLAYVNSKYTLTNGFSTAHTYKIKYDVSRHQN